MSFAIAPYSQTHFAGVKALWEEVFPDDPPRDYAETSIAAKANEHPELFLPVATDGDRVIGSVMAGYDGHRGLALSGGGGEDASRHLGVGAALIPRRKSGLGARLRQNQFAGARRQSKRHGILPKSGICGGGSHQHGQGCARTLTRQGAVDLSPPDDSAFLFPGQGSQAVGMGKALTDAFVPAREVFQEVDDALSQKLSRLMWEGPESDLTLTENAQPAIMALSIAIIRVLQKEAGLDLARHARLVAGHSLGEYSALSAAGAFALADTARLLKIRGQAMQSAVPVGEGAMIALIGADIEVAEAVAKSSSSLIALPPQHIPIIHGLFRGSE